MPRTPEEWNNISDDFYKLWQFPHCIGCMDGKHVMIQAPANSGSEFYNYKGFFSIVLLALVDAQYRFMFVNVGSQGRISDGGVFSNTTLKTMLENDSLNIPAARPLPGRILPTPYVFLTDDAFPLNRNIMKPYPGLHNKGSKERVFNYRLSRARRVVENVFGIMSSKFRLLRKPLLLNPTKSSDVILACTYLHNFLIKSYLSRSFYVGHNMNFQQNNLDIDTVNDLITVELENDITEAAGVRKEFADFFLTNIGSVPWQTNY